VTAAKKKTAKPKVKVRMLEEEEKVRAACEAAFIERVGVKIDELTQQVSSVRVLCVAAALAPAMLGDGYETIARRASQLVAAVDKQCFDDSLEALKLDPFCQGRAPVKSA
jgi:hypothetical protein